MNNGIVSISFVFLLSTCTPKPQESQQSIADSLTIENPEGVIAVVPADSTQLITEEQEDSLADSVGLDYEGAQTAVLFLNEYVKPPPGGKGWFYSPLLTDSFKKAYKDLIGEAERNDPEYGLGFDPILCAQDEPSAFSVKTFSKSGYVTVQGVDWPSFTVTVRLIRQDSIWLVEGSGVINIPKEKQAAR